MEEKDFNNEKKWHQLLEQLGRSIGKKPRDLNALLFLIGVQELGKGKRAYSREEKRDLIHIAICKVLSLSGYYRLEGYDEDGWPHWVLMHKLPYADLLQQEVWLRAHIIHYFEKETGLELS